MNKADLLVNLREFIQNCTADLTFPVHYQRNDEEETEAVPAVYLMRLPDDSESWKKKVPYVIVQAVTGTDSQVAGDTLQSSCLVRMVFCVYNTDSQEGALRLLELMERVRISLLRRQIIGAKYQLDMQEKLEMLVYTDDTAPYFGGELVSVWRMPAPERELPWQTKNS